MRTDQANPPGLSLRRLFDHLIQELSADAGEEFDVRLLPGGRSNVSYRITHGGSDWVLRRPPLGNVLPSAHDMAREFRVLSGLFSVGFPVPEPLLLCEDTSVIGSAFMVMEFIPGRTIATEADAAMLSAPEATATSRSLVHSLARLHQVDIDAAKLRQLGRPEGYLVRQVRRWTEQWSRTKTRELPEIDALIRWLNERIPRLPDDLPSAIVHGDFRIDNVILTENLSVKAVLDWEMSTLGDPVSDLAISLVYWSEAGDGLRRQLEVAKHVTSGSGFATRADVAEEYSRLTGLNLDHLPECLVLACFKLAVIMESIHKRTLAGKQLGSRTDGDMAMAATALARMGINVARGEGLSGLSL